MWMKPCVKLPWSVSLKRTGLSLAHYCHGHWKLRDIMQGESWHDCTEKLMGNDPHANGCQVNTKGTINAFDQWGTIVMRHHFISSVFQSSISCRSNKSLSRPLSLVSRQLWMVEDLLVNTTWAFPLSCRKIHTCSQSESNRHRQLPKPRKEQNRTLRNLLINKKVSI